MLGLSKYSELGHGPSQLLDEWEPSRVVAEKMDGAVSAQLQRTAEPLISLTKHTHLHILLQVVFPAPYTRHAAVERETIGKPFDPRTGLARDQVPCRCYHVLSAPILFSWRVGLESRARAPPHDAR